MNIQYVKELENTIIRVVSAKNVRVNANIMTRVEHLLGDVTNDFCKVYGYSRRGEIAEYKRQHAIPREVNVKFWQAISEKPIESSIFRNMVSDRLLMMTRDFSRIAMSKVKGTDFMALIAPLAVGDRSNGKHATFTKVYKRMPVDFSKFKYKGSKRNALEIPEIKKIFIKTVNEMLAELNEE